MTSFCVCNYAALSEANASRAKVAARREKEGALSNWDAIWACALLGMIILPGPKNLLLPHARTHTYTHQGLDEMRTHARWCGWDANSKNSSGFLQRMRQLSWMAQIRRERHASKLKEDECNTFGGGDYFLVPATTANQKRHEWREEGVWHHIKRENCNSFFKALLGEMSTNKSDKWLLLKKEQPLNNEK